MPPELPLEESSSVTRAMRRRAATLIEESFVDEAVQWGQAAANVLGSVVLCLVGVWLGAMLAGSINQMR